MLAFLTTALARPDDAQITALKAEINDLRGERDDWRRIAEGWRDYVRRMPVSDVQQTMQHQLNVIPSQMNQLLDGFCNCVPARHDLFLRKTKL